MTIPKGMLRPSSPARPLPPLNPLASEGSNLQHIPNTPRFLWMFRVWWPRAVLSDRDTRGCCDTSDKSQLTAGKLELRVRIPAQVGQGDAISLGISIPAKRTWWKVGNILWM